QTRINRLEPQWCWPRRERKRRRVVRREKAKRNLVVRARRAKVSRKQKRKVRKPRPNQKANRKRRRRVRRRKNISCQRRRNQNIIIRRRPVRQAPQTYRPQTLIHPTIHQRTRIPGVHRGVITLVSTRAPA